MSTEGLLVGGSAGTALWAAREVGRELGPEHLVVVLIPDSGRQYLSKIYDDDWMADNGFLDYPGQDGHGYTVFGKVVDGMDVVQKIGSTPTGHADRPLKDGVINTIKVDRR